MVGTIVFITVPQKDAHAGLKKIDHSEVKPDFNTNFSMANL
jgi:hypothetical protein